jgi:regulatory protein
MQQVRNISSINRNEKIKSHFDIYINDQYACTIHEDILVKYRLLSEIEVPDELFQLVLKDQQIQEAYLRVIKWLALRHRTEQEIRVFLKKKNVKDKIIDECIFRLMNENYINDIQTSMHLAEERITKQGKGKRWVSNELMHKGVDSSLINQVISHIDDQQELNSAIKIGQKKWQLISSKFENIETITKLYNFLSRRGYSSPIVRKAIHHITSTQIDEEPFEFTSNN